MLKCTVTYEDFNGKSCTEDLWFHVSKTAVLMAKDDIYNQIVNMGKELQEKAKLVEAIEKRTPPQSSNQTGQDAPVDPETFFKDEQALADGLVVAEAVRTMARLLDKLVDLAYGKRSPDGSRFIKNDEVLREWKESMAYDAFVEKMIYNPKEMQAFIETLMKK